MLKKLKHSTVNLYIGAKLRRITNREVIKTRFSSHQVLFAKMTLTELGSTQTMANIQFFYNIKRKTLIVMGKIEIVQLASAKIYLFKSYSTLTF